MQALIDVILPVFLVIGAGYGLTLVGLFPQGAVDGLMKYAQGIAVPCLLFLALARIDLQAALNPGLLVSFYAGALISFTAGLFGARYFVGRDWEDSVAIAFCCLFSNSVLLGLSIVERAFGAAALAGAYAIVAFHAPFCYGVGIAVMEIVKHRGEPPIAALRSIGKAMFQNALVIAIALGLAVNLVGLQLPNTLTDALDLVAGSALPAALFALGGVLVQYRPEGDIKAILMVCVLSLFLHPAITWALGKSFAVPADLFNGAVLTAGMAPGFNAYIFANMYGRARRVAASSVLCATGASLLTAWLWLLALS